MDTFLTIYYWVKVAVVALTVVLAFFAAWRMTGKRRLVRWREVMHTVLASGLFAALVWATDPSFNLIWTIVLGLLGLFLGFLVGKRAKRFATTRGGVGIRRSPLAPWVWAMATILVSLTLLFGSSYLFALAMLLLVFALGTVIGQVAGELSGSRPLEAKHPV